MFAHENMLSVCKIVKEMLMPWTPENINNNLAGFASALRNAQSMLQASFEGLGEQ